MFRKINVLSIPSLEQSGFVRYLSFAALYIAQGIPNGLIFYAIPAWLALNGASAAEIGGLVAISILPWSMKLINGPVMDRFSFLKMGRRRPWILAGQTGMVISFLLMSLIHNPLENLWWLMFFGFVVNFFTAFQDVATDGMAIDIVPVDQQARANGIMWGAKTIGISASVAAGSWMIHSLGFSSTIIIFSLFIFLIMLIPLLIRERKGESLLPWTKGEASPEAQAIQLESWKEIFTNLWRVFMLPVSLVMGMAAFSSSLGRGFIDVVIPLLTVQELGWADTHYSNIFAASQLAAGALGMIIGGFLVDRFGKKRMMSLFISMLGLLVLMMSFFSYLWHIESVVIAFVIVFYVLTCFLEIAVFASAMNLCWKKISATQFTLYMTISNLGLSAGSAVIGPLKEFFSYDQMILFYILTASAMFIFLRFVNFEKHQKRLEILDELTPVKTIIPEPAVS
jgi:MFS transporter, PAT family, beta-lactamase induction signal transducer AmpG